VTVVPWMLADPGRPGARGKPHGKRRAGATRIRSKPMCVPVRCRPAAVALAVVLGLSLGCASQPRAASAPVHGAVTRIVFVGDSLVHRASSDYGMLDTIRDGLTTLFPYGSFEIVDAGNNGDRITDILKRLDVDVLALRPDAVVLYWDSDVSDVDESRITPEERKRVRAAYERDVSTVLQRLVSSGAHVVMSGPTLIGERPHPRNAKDRQLDHYRDLNGRLAAAAGVSYIDTRRAFQAARPIGSPAMADHGLLTEDGEHLNAAGARLAGTLFIRGLDSWLRRRPSGDRSAPGLGRSYNQQVPWL
jgi:lysophospholipase L1-like esterase